MVLLLAHLQGAHRIGHVGLVNPLQLRDLEHDGGDVVNTQASASDRRSQRRGLALRDRGVLPRVAGGLLEGLPRHPHAKSGDAANRA